MAIVAVVAGLWQWPWLNLPRLADRLARPLADVPAVTRVRLAVRPTPDVAVAGRPLTITATAANLADADRVTLHVAHTDTWAARLMDPAGDAYATDVSTADGDLRWYVTAGDARTPTHIVRVLPVPALIGLRLGPDAPPAMSLAAPAGGAVDADVVATIPLRSTTLTIGTTTVATTPTADPAVRRGRITVRTTGLLTIRLTSAEGVSATTTVPVHAIAAGGVAGYEDQQRAYRFATTRQAPEEPHTK